MEALTIVTLVLSSALRLKFGQIASLGLFWEDCVHGMASL